MAPYNYSNVGSYFTDRDEYSDMLTPVGSALPSGAFQGAVLLPSGKVVFVPYNSGNVCTYVNEGGGVLSNSVAHNQTVPAYSGGVLDSGGNVAMFPARKSIPLASYKPDQASFTTYPFSFDGSFLGGVLLPNGNIVMVANTNANICQFNPSYTAVSNSVNVGASGTQKYAGGVLAPNGNVIMIPQNSNVGVFNPYTLAFSNIVTNTAKFSFCGGCLLPSGNVIMAPFASANVGMVDPIALTYSNSTPLIPGQGSFTSASLVQDGRVLFTSLQGNVCILSTVTPPNKEFFLSPYFNKF